MKIAITERQAATVACVRYTGPFGEPLGKFWRRIVMPMLADNDLIDCPRYGVALDNPMNTPPEKCRYDACVELPRGLQLPGAHLTVIPGGCYAVTHYKGTAAAIGAGWSALVGATLAEAVYRVDPKRHSYESYPRGASYDARTGVFACELCLPISDRAHGS